MIEREILERAALLFDCEEGRYRKLASEPLLQSPYATHYLQEAQTCANAAAALRALAGESVFVKVSDEH